jgi:tetratricopeptide (TPR) repeat protein
MSFHDAVRDGVTLTWNNQFEQGEEFYAPIKDTSPRAALEYAHMKTLQAGGVGNKRVYREHIRRYGYAECLAMVMKLGGPDYKPDLAARLALEEEGGDEEMTEKQLEALEKKAESEDKKILTAATKHAKTAKTAITAEWELECEAIQAEAMFLRGFYQAASDQYLKGGMRLRKSYKLFQELLKRIEGGRKYPQELQDLVLWGVGLFYILLSLLPAALTKVLTVIGFKSDQKAGEQYLTGVFEREGIRSGFSCLILALYYSFAPSGLNDYHIALDKALPILKAANERYPTNSYFYMLTCTNVRKDGRTEEALDAIRKTIANYADKKNLPHLYYFIEADTLYINFSFEEVVARGQEIFALFEERGESFDMAGVMSLEIAAACYNLGRTGEVKKWLESSVALGNAKNKQDGPAIAWSRRLLADPSLLPFIGVSIFYFQWRNMHHLALPAFDRLEEMLAAAKEAAGEKSSWEAKMAHELFLAVIQHRRGADDKAVATLGRMFAFEKQVALESPIYPAAYYELAELQYHLGNLAEAENLFKKGSKLKGDGNETVASRYKLALQQVKRPK